MVTLHILIHIITSGCLASALAWVTMRPATLQSSDPNNKDQLLCSTENHCTPTPTTSSTFALKTPCLRPIDAMMPSHELLLLQLMHIALSDVWPHLRSPGTLQTRCTSSTTERQTQLSENNHEPSHRTLSYRRFLNSGLQWNPHLYAKDGA